MNNLLTARELEILISCAKGYTNNAIAEHLFISNHTVKKHLAHIYFKLNISSRVLAIIICLKSGVLDINEL